MRVNESSSILSTRKLSIVTNMSIHLYYENLINKFISVSCATSEGITEILYEKKTNKVSYPFTVIKFCTLSYDQ